MIELYTAGTPNGWKASVALEELELPYTVRPISLSADEQKEPWFLELNPNGRIPAMVDHAPDPSYGEGDFTVFESGAMLIYLADKAGELLPRDPRGRSRALQWLMFQIGGVGPMMGQANVFVRYAPEQIEYAIGRYQRESRRLLEVLDGQLGKTEYLAGDEYSIADIANFCWARTYEWPGISIEGLDHLCRWLEQLGARPAVKRGLDVPKPIEEDEQTKQRRIEGAKKMLA